MQFAVRATVLVIAAAALAFVLQLQTGDALAQSSFYVGRGCVDCHDSAPSTCNGCHHHGRSGLTAATNKTSYAPGETVSATLRTSSTRGGWVRAVLYDQNNVQLAISSGSDGGMGSSTTLPATLTAPAPSTPGSYIWKMAYFGNEDGSGAGDVHSERVVNMAAFTVVAQTAAPTVSSVTPASLAQGAVNQTVTIAGTNLTGGTVTFSNAGITRGTATVTATSISLPVSVSAGAAVGAGTVTVTTAGGSASSAFSVTAQAAAPTVSSVTPASLVQGAVNQTVTIAGANLTGGTVTFSNAGITRGTATVTATSISLPVSVSAGATVGAGTVTVTTAGGSSSRTFSVTAASVPLTISTSTIPAGQLNTSYSQSLAATGGVPPYSWGVVGGSLPPGLGLSGSSGLIIGVPTQPGVFAFTASLVDNGGTNTSKPLSITIANGTCTNGVVRISTAPSVYYADIASACLAAANGSTIQIQNFVFSSDIVLDQNKTIALEGGYDCGYATRTGATGTYGMVRVVNGTVKVGNLRLM